MTEARTPADRVTLVLPVFNEEEAIAPFFEAMAPVEADCRERFGVAFSFLFVDDGSTDRTAEILRTRARADPRVGLISFSRNFGKETALTAGLDYADGAAVIPYDIDLQDPPEVIAGMIARWRDGARVVVGIRESREEEGVVKRVTARLFYRACTALGAGHIRDNAGDFRLLDRSVVRELRRFGEANRFMKGLFSWVGFRTEAIRYRRRSRSAGRTKWNYWKLWNFALDGITGFTTAPLRIWSYFGVLVSFGAFLYGAFIFLRTLLYGVDVPGFATIVVFLTLLGGLQMIGLGVLGEYVGRIYLETKRRPRYIVAEAIRPDGAPSAADAAGSRGEAATDRPGEDNHA